ncbi:thiolase C-terminal domain-containing protein [uncultured Microbacterium sp.]|uniref:thiolase C-terminal domain-containing protein n=1 Tax=uncultured Microbacterium sp. TaxID=191216 RepID=UPI0025D9F5C2|nr:lipid-transfer protein [uncultured Microbacterium sp.]
MSVVVAGVGMIPFSTPRAGGTYDDMGAEAARRALADAGIGIADVAQAYAGYVYADSAAGQTALYGLGPTGIPVINVNNWCASGSTALWLGRQAILSGMADCVLVLGFEQMARGAIAPVYADRPDALWRFTEMLGDQEPEAPVAARFFGAAGQAYLDRYDADATLFAEVAVKARRHARANPAAVFRDPVTVEEVLASPHVFGPLSRLQCCPPTCGAAAAVLCTEDFARTRGLDASVRIRAQSMTSDRADSFQGDAMALVGAGIARRAADAVYEDAGVSPEDVPVAELHDCFTANEIISYEALRLTSEGTSARFVRDGQNTYGGRVVTNPSGGLLSKGHPLGATGLAQCTELVQQLRGRAGERQVDGAALALQHNLGLGSACVVTLYESIRR